METETEGKPAFSDRLEDCSEMGFGCVRGQERTALGNGWDHTGTAATRAALAVVLVNELDMVGSQVRISGLPFRVALSGWRVQAISGRKRKEKLIIPTGFRIRIRINLSC